jgi:aquaporin NIP
MLNPLWRKAGAELIGTFGLVTAGCGAIITTQTSSLSPILVALAFGLVIAVMIAATGHISGGHINPAVSIGLAVTGKLPWAELPAYVLAQLVGAILAALTLLGFFGSQLATTVNAPNTALHVSMLQAGLMEVVLTAFLVFVISAVATDNQSVGKLAAFAIGGTITLGALWGGPISGASMNPARSFGPALISALTAGHVDWQTILLAYIVGPIIGGIIGAALYHFIRLPDSAAQEEVADSTESPTTPRPKVAPVAYKNKARTRR